MCGCEAHWSQRSEGLTEQTMERDVHNDDEYCDDGDDNDDDVTDLFLYLHYESLPVSGKVS